MGSRLKRFLITLSILLIAVPVFSSSEEDKMVLAIGDKTFSAVLSDTVSADAFKALLEEGDITISMSDYGGFEKVGNLGQSLPRSDESMTTEPGDIVLYNGRSIVVFYGSNRWAYTMIGHLDDPQAFRDAVGGRDVDITFSLE